MLNAYFKETHKKLPLLTLLRLNFFSFILTSFFFFILPLTIRRYYIIGNELSNIIKCVFLFLFELNTIAVAIAVKDLKVKKDSKNLTKISVLTQIKEQILTIIICASVKTFALIFFIYAFRIALKMNLYTSFFLSFFYFLFFFIVFWLPSIVANKKMSFIKAIYGSACLFTLHPFFTFCVFIHSLILFFLSFFLFNLYPSSSRILFNLNIGYRILSNSLEFSDHDISVS